MKSLSHVWLFATPWTAAYQAPPSMGFSRQEYWSGVPLPSPSSSSVMSNSLAPHGLQHTRLPCPSPSPGACSNSYLLSQWCHPTILSSVIPFFSWLQSYPASVSFLMSQFFASDDQSIGVSASALVLPMNIQDLFPLGWTGWISLHPRDSQESSPTPQFKSIDCSVLSLLYGSILTSIHDYWKNHSFEYTDLCQKSNVSAF